MTAATSDKTFMNWSSGKDASMALWQLQQKGVEVDLLLTTINSENNRISMHGLSRDVLLRQSACVNIPIITVPIDPSADHDVYTRTMQEAMGKLKIEGYTQSAFGDIFLADLRAYRERQLESVGMTALFPLWGKSTENLAECFFQHGFEAIVVSVNGRLMDQSFAGRKYDAQFLADLPEGIDPCGENGEFHTFCYAGPIFSKPVQFKVGDIQTHVYSHNGEDFPYHFCELH